MIKDDNDWVSQAVCKGVPNATKIFFLERGMNSNAAKKICGTCPVTSECLEYALSFNLHEDSFGIFGGMTPQEREDLRRDRGMLKSTVDLASTQS
jgi:WhiB family redox-sensing transcriptional regulator